MNGNILRSFIKGIGLSPCLPKPYIFKNALCTSVTDSVSTDSPASSVSESTTTSDSIAPIIIEKEYNTLRRTTEAVRQAWVESLNSTKDDRVGLVSLHPDIFATVPRLDIIHENVVWQTKYKLVNYEHAKVPEEMRGPGKGRGRKPWPQKGTGRARHGSMRGPQWNKGGTVHGPRKFSTHFFMLPFTKRVYGLVHTLSCKFAQDDIKVVTSLDIPSAQSSFLEELVEERRWGASVLFCDVDDVMPENITAATEEEGHFNLLPVYGLNVHSMLKHETLVLTVAAVERIQDRLLTALHTPSIIYKNAGVM